MNDIHIHGFHDTHVTIKWLKEYLLYQQFFDLQFMKPLQGMAPPVLNLNLSLKRSLNLSLKQSLRLSGALKKLSEG